MFWFQFLRRVREETLRFHVEVDEVQRLDGVADAREAYDRNYGLRCSSDERPT